MDVMLYRSTTYYLCSDLEKEVSKLWQNEAAKTDFFVHPNHCFYSELHQERRLSFTYLNSRDGATKYQKGDKNIPRHFVTFFPARYLSLTIS